MNSTLPANLFFNFDLPKSLIANAPSDKRDMCSLLYYNSGKITDYKFSEIVNLIPKNSYLVRNVSRVIPARLRFMIDKSEHELFFLKKINNKSFVALVRPGKKFKIGKVFRIGGFVFEVLSVSDSGHRIIQYVGNIHSFDILAFLESHGEVPLPPYIDVDDPNYYKDRYQTVFAKTKGSVAAPTASLHFTDQVLKKLEDKGVKFIDVCLHVGLGTFAPIKESIFDHEMHSEYYEFSEAASVDLNHAKVNNNPIIALGTTALRVLQTVFDFETNKFVPQQGETQIFIKPPFDDFVVDGILTNFHLPKSTLLLLINAFIGCEATRKIYEHAMASDYRFYSFGDASLLMR